jgi:hypothetical protein
MKHIKLFEHWQGFIKAREEEEDREYRVTVDRILTWAVGPEWSDDWSWMPDILMVDDEFPEDGECIGYLELLKKNRDLEVDVSSQEIDGQIDSSWFIGDTVFDLITWEWPFEEADSLDDLEQAIVRKLAEEIGEEGLRRMGANAVDLVDFVSQASSRGDALTELSSIGFRNWLELQRGGIN